MTTLAIVDDHEAMRDGLAMLLVARGVEVLGTAGNAMAGVDLVAHTHPEVALVDVDLPDGSGVELVRTLVAEHPSLGVILYSSDARPGLLSAGRQAGARGHVLKASSVDELLVAIERVAGGGTYVDPRLGRADRTDEPNLSPRERQILQLMGEGHTADSIARLLVVSVETVRTHVRNAIRKLDARNRVHAIAMALERGDIALER